ncbi:MAG: hypothetical protein V3S65_09850, partial [Candidatus Aminicenantaceae bacterium]
MHRIKRKTVVLIIYCLVIFSFSVSQTMDEPIKNEMLRIIDQKSQLLIDVSDKIWEYAEIAVMEYESSKLL